jgi:hypothetical protein
MRYTLRQFDLFAHAATERLKAMYGDGRPPRGQPQM